MDWKCSKNRSYAKTICKTSSQAESFAMLHFSHCEKENLVILMMRVRQEQNPEIFVTIEGVLGVNRSFVWICKENVCFYQGYNGKLFGFEMMSKTNQEMYALTIASFIFWFTIY